MTATIDQTRALHHYTALATQAQAWREGQDALRTQQQMRDELFAEWDAERYDPTDDPRTWVVASVDAFEDDATKAARDEVERNPYDIAWWLNEEVGLSTECLDDMGIKRLHPTDWTLQQALVMVMRGTNQQTLDAVHRLRELFGQSAYIKQRISDVAGELLAEFRGSEGEQQ